MKFTIYVMDNHAAMDTSYELTIEATIEDIVSILDDYDNPERECGCCAPVAVDANGRKYYAPRHMFGRQR